MIIIETGCATETQTHEYIQACTYAQKYCFPCSISKLTSLYLHDHLEVLFFSFTFNYRHCLELQYCFIYSGQLLWCLLFSYSSWYLRQRGLLLRKQKPNAFEIFCLHFLILSFCFDLRLGYCYIISGWEKPILYAIKLCL